MDVALFAVFALHHSMMPRQAMKQWFASVAPAPLERTVYVWIASILLAVVCLAWQDVPGVAYNITGAWGWVLRLLQYAGIALSIVLLLLSLAVCLARVSPRRLRPLGWALVGSSVVTLAVLVVGLR